MPETLIARTSQPEVLGRLRTAVETEIAELEQAYADRPLSTVAWSARYLLELFIWVEYCAASEENAKTFADDCARDAIDAIDLPQEFSIDETFSHRSARAEIIDKAKSAGFDTVDEGFTRVSNAAKSIGRGDLFKYTNKLCSKFAHPTALTVMTPMEEFEEGFKKKFLEAGRALAVHAIRIVSDFNK